MCNGLTATTGLSRSDPATPHWHIPVATVPQEAGLQRGCGTKIWRGTEMEFARRLLAHASTSTTQRYMHLDDRELANAQELVK